MALNIKNINIDVLTYILSFMPKEGKCILGGYLEFDLNQLNDLRICTIVEFLRDIIFFCSEKFFDIYLIHKLMELSNELLLIIANSSLIDLLKYYEQEVFKLSKNADTIAIKNLKIYMKFLHLVFFQNFKLYQYLMQYPQENYYRCLDLKIDIPPLLPLLSDSTELSVFNYAVEVGRLDAEAEEMQKTSEMLKWQTDQRKDAGLNLVYNDLLNMSDSCERETEIKKAITDLATIQLCALSTKLMTNITDIKNEIEIKITKLELPKPVSLISL